MAMASPSSIAILASVSPSPCFCSPSPWESHSNTNATSAGCCSGSLSLLSAPSSNHNHSHRRPRRLCIRFGIGNHPTAAYCWTLRQHWFPSSTPHPDSRLSCKSMLAANLIEEKGISSSLDPTFSGGSRVDDADLLLKPSPKPVLNLRPNGGPVHQAAANAKTSDTASAVVGDRDKVIESLDEVLNKAEKLETSSPSIPSSKEIKDGVAYRVFTSTPDKENNKYYLGPAPVGEMARQIAIAHGPCGDNREYLFLLEKALSDIGHEDEYVIELANEVRKELGRLAEKKAVAAVAAAAAGAHIAFKSHLPRMHLSPLKETTVVDSR